MKKIFHLLMLILISNVILAQSNNFFLVNLAIEEKSVLNIEQNILLKDLLFKTSKK